MTSLSTIEQEAAKVLEFNGFNKYNHDEMVKDMNLCYKGKYSRGVRRELFKTILESSSKKEELMEYINHSRTADRENLTSVMTDASVEEVIAEHNHDEDDAIKYWYYRLFPTYSPSEITERHDAAIASIAQREIDQYEFSDELLSIAEHWMEFYEFNFTQFETEMARDLYRSMMDLLYDGLTSRMCFRILRNIYSNQTPAKMAIDKKMQAEKAPIDDDELRRVLQKVQQKFELDIGSEDEWNAFVKELFTDNWDDYTIKEIRELADAFYTEEVGRSGPVVYECDVVELDSDDDVNENIGEIEISDDDDEDGGNAPASPSSKRSRIK